MSQVKMPYYPKVVATSMETTFGSIEMSCPELYESPIDGIQILRVDLLQCLLEDIGYNCMLYRDLCYKLIAGSCSSAEEHVALFESAYRRYHVFTSYVNNLYYYGESSIPLIPRVLGELRDKVNKYCNTVSEQLVASGGKFLMHTHDYVYYGFKNVVDIPDIRGGKLIC